MKLFRSRADENVVPSTERHFYSKTQAFGRFGMRLFAPQVMPAPHWHGHIEANFLTDGAMIYDIDGEEVVIPARHLVLFWASVPHRLSRLDTPEGAQQKLCNIYIPVDTFLFMPHIAALQVILLSGAMVVLPEDICGQDQVERWYSDYRSGDFERASVVKMELNALLRRALLHDLTFLRKPLVDARGDRAITSVNIRHVVAMVRFIMEHLSDPIRNADVAKVTGLHENYALSLFTQTMRLPMKQFVIRLRLLRARAMLTESSTAITTVAESSGFTSISQFYHHFRENYGMTPKALRENYVRMSLR